MIQLLRSKILASAELRNFCGEVIMEPHEGRSAGGTKSHSQGEICGTSQAPKKEAGDSLSSKGSPRGGVVGGGLP